MGQSGIATDVFRARVARLQEKAEMKGFDGVFVFSDEYRAGNTVYLSDYKPINVIEESPEAVYIEKGREPVLFLGAINAQAARKVSWIADVRPIESLHLFFEDVRKRLQKMNAKPRIGLVGDSLLPVRYYRKLIEPLPEGSLFPADELISEMRQVKDKDEIALMQQAAHQGDLAIRAGIERLKKGNATEIDVAAEAEYLIRSRGGDIGSATVLSSGVNTEAPTWRPSEKLIQPGEAVLIDVNPSFRGYCSDVAVTIFNGRPAGSGAKVLEFSRSTVLGLVDRMRPGLPASFIFDYFLERVQKAGYEKYFVPYAKGLRAVGHSVGLDVVERPNLDSDAFFHMEPGMTLGVKFDLHGLDFGGLRMETVVLVEEKGCRSLNAAVEEVGRENQGW